VLNSIPNKKRSEHFVARGVEIEMKKGRWGPKWTLIITKNRPSFHSQKNERGL